MTRTPYQTKQRRAVLDCFARHPGMQMSAADVAEWLSQNGGAAGRTTVYRTVAWLHQNGHLTSYRDPKDPGGVKYSLRAKGERSVSVVCSGCGSIAPLRCEAVDEFERHLSAEHGFTLSQQDCVLPGLCADCAYHQKTQS